MSNDNRNFITFAIFAVLILFGTQIITHWFYPANPPVTKIEGGKTQVQPNRTAPVPSTAATLQSLDKILNDPARQKVTIATPTLKGSINLRGARIDDLVLSRYPETIAKNSPPIRLLSPAGAPDAYYASFGWDGLGAGAPNGDTVWTASGGALTPTTPVTLTTQNGQGQRFAIELAIDDQYMFTIRQTIANDGGAPVQVATRNAILRADKSKDPDTWTIQVGPMSTHNDGADYGVNWGDVDKAAQTWTSTGGWIGFTDKYWLTALIPDQHAGFTGSYTSGGGKDYQSTAALNPVALPPGRQLSQTSRFFAGAKEVRILNDYQDKGGVQHFGRAIDWGWFEIIEKPIFTYLDWLFRMVGNFGVAIMLLTLTIRALIFPIAQRQFASMAAMRAIQPKMKALQERYKDDKQRQQQEIMKLYKTEKVNPLAGCLPTLIQIPIMYSLYKVLMLTIEMRHQPFVAWIKDLSAPDPAMVLNLFGYLHFTPPGFLAIGVVPVLLGISMWLQFRMNPAPMDPTQKQVFAFMPWVLMFVMAPFAVGLQVYWITSNLLTVLQQKLLYSRHPELMKPVTK